MIFKNIISAFFFFFLYKRVFLENENEIERNNRQKNFSIVPDFVQLWIFSWTEKPKGKASADILQASFKS